METEFSIGQIVKGIRTGMYVIIGFRTLPLENEIYAQVKPYCPIRQKVERGEMALPLTALVAIN